MKKRKLGLAFYEGGGISKMLLAMDFLLLACGIVELSVKNFFVGLIVTGGAICMVLFDLNLI